MRFREHKQIAAVILAVIIAVALIASLLKTGDGPAGLKENLQGAASYVTEPVSKAADGIRKGFGGIFRFKELTAENQRLIEETDRLKQENAGLALKREEKEELEELSQVFHYDAARENDLQAADIIAMDYSNWEGVFTINKGSEEGIRTGCTVVSGDGLVGKITEVSKRTAKVAMLLSDNNKISFRTAGEKGRTGVLQSDGGKGLKGYLLEEGESVSKGDTLMTSGIGLYAKGIKIGRITDVEKKTGTQRVVVEAEPAVSFFQLRKVAVIL
ncbi:rod shape-determining protein MreC [Anaerovorax odorimutans]|uniref:Cell shape-determining protein MreC n=1 Tax=Anaerovorax odorimutans TaxID=109327 RepID=A0ABT1RSB0_9FIRM|nr:rod shape-determining protein MreC [Anaerovorax odorimutans]MCQ4638085.1 rod shape-determining protein MreC [Anaerovorax odorimutans]